MSKRRKHHQAPLNEEALHAGAWAPDPQAPGSGAMGASSASAAASVGTEGDDLEDDAPGTEHGDRNGLTQRVVELEREAAEARDRNLRTLADFDNYRKRQTAELADIRRYANESLIADLLPVLDNFERALAASSNQENPAPIVEGIQLTHRQLEDVLRKAGLEPIEAEGQPFDPTVHEAVGTVEPEEGQAPHQVVQELRKGYRLNNKLLRASLVKVTGG